MKQVLPHSMLGDDLGDAQELMENFLSISRYLEGWDWQPDDLAKRYCVFVLPVVSFSQGLAPATFYFKAPSHWTILAVYLASEWTGAGDVTVTVRTEATTGPGGTVLATGTISQAAPEAEPALTAIHVPSGHFLKIFLTSAGVANCKSVSIMITIEAPGKLGA